MISKSLERRITINSLIALLALVFCSVASTSSAPDLYAWSRSGPVVGDVNALAIAPSNAAVRYAGIETSTGGVGVDSNRGVYKSLDGGTTWSKAGLPGKSILALAVDPGNAGIIYCGTNNGLYKSTDGGGNWNGPYVSSTATVAALLVDPNNPATLFAGVSGNGIYKSVDAGLTWSTVNTGRSDHLPTAARQSRQQLCSESDAATSDRPSCRSAIHEPAQLEFS
ncbi:MAG: hypothetical protein JWM21_4700 [Acidobacteria bacterium]|nr:hypothetical protein [Acidobacteriota bacterium]